MIPRHGEDGQGVETCGGVLVENVTCSRSQGVQNVTAAGQLVSTLKGMGVVMSEAIASRIVGDAPQACGSLVATPGMGVASTSGILVDRTASLDRAGATGSSGGSGSSVVGMGSQDATTSGFAGGLENVEISGSDSLVKGSVDGVPLQGHGIGDGMKGVRSVGSGTRPKVHFEDELDDALSDGSISVDFKKLFELATNFFPEAKPKDVRLSPPRCRHEELLEDGPLPQAPVARFTLYGRLARTRSDVSSKFARMVEEGEKPTSLLQGE